MDIHRKDMMSIVTGGEYIFLNPQPVVLLNRISKITRTDGRLKPLIITSKMMQVSPTSKYRITMKNRDSISLCWYAGSIMQN